MPTTLVLRDSKLYSSTTSLLHRTIGAGAINWPALALARFILAFIVVASHALRYTDAPGPLFWLSRFSAFNAIIGFLLISGLSIGKSLLKDSDGYYKRRAQRIYPVYLVSIALQYLIIPEALSGKFFLLLFTNVFFLNQITTSISYVGPAWTLALEVWLYALAPFLLKLSYKNLLYLIGLSFASYVVYTCGRTLFHWPYYSGTTYGINLPLLAFIWIAGFLLATFEQRIKTTSFLIALILSGHFVLSLLIEIGAKIKNHRLASFMDENGLNFAFEAICLAFIYYVVISNRTLPTFSATSKKVFNFLGNISYPLYLSHYVILVLCHKNHLTHWFILVSCCLAVSCLIYWLFDFYSKRRAG
ncbi:MAG: acyltransferase [Hymenobacter sp.]|nr:MAG: acyltransferase [Hymenobacter sp.]